jgi:hypothetical protein
MIWRIAVSLTALVTLVLPREADAAPAPKATVAANPAERSTGFWDDVKDLRQSESWQALQNKVGLSDKSRGVAAEAVKAGKQGVVSISLDTPRDTAAFLNGAAQPGRDLGVERAVSTALRMRASPEMVTAAAPMVEPQARAEVASFRANLSSGIPGLPGVYLCGGGPCPRASAPQGYAPVAGESRGCGR